MIMAILSYKSLMITLSIFTKLLVCKIQASSHKKYSFSYNYILIK
ncbi:hypothetical protein VCHA50P420_100040 [Vibrio chagasii]|nr:hypothetical protein VCHA50P420_100040 [Vibrio chagasii]